MSEFELIAGCKRGDRSAQRELYTRTSEKVYRLLVKMTRNLDTAYDLAQEAYLKAFSRINQFNGESSLGTWLYRIAVNEALQFLRRKGSLSLVSECDPADASAAGDSRAVALRMDVNAGLDQLEANERAILILRYQEGLDYRAIAEVMDCPAGTVASRLNRARDRLRQVLGSDYGASEERTGEKHPMNAG